VTTYVGIDRLFPSSPSGPIDDAALVVEGETITWVGTRADAPADDDRVDLGGGLLTAGLVDAHTHPVYAGHRFAEIAARTAGATYSELAAAGGGINATVRSTRAAAAGELRAAVAERLAAWPAGGATTVEVKTGYHLERDGELAAVQTLHELSGTGGVPELRVTFLGAHAVPPERAGDADGYVDEVASWMSAAAAAGAHSCDVFCDEGYFTVEQSRRVVVAGAAAGLRARIHADELARTGGSRLAADVGAASADHLLCIDAGDAQALAAAGVTAVLCPVTALGMGRVPPVGALRAAGATIALGTDHNPGTSGLTDMSAVIGLAVTALGLSVADALVAATAGGARSLGLGDRGTIAPGRRADLVLWDADHEGAFAWALGLPPRRVWRAGHPLL
jgi:imidazolonepropionase